jgi:hypothetical protein
MQITPATFPAMGFDLDASIPNSADALQAAGMSFALRYLSLGRPG